MAKCVDCGKQYNWFTKTGMMTGRCNECYAKLREKHETERLAREEMKRTGEDDAKARLMSIVKQHIGSEKLKVFGVAYWDTSGTIASSVFDKVVGAALLGGLGSQMTGKTHRVGVIAVAGTRLYIIETGQVVGEKVKASEMLRTSDKISVKSANLKNLKIQDKEAIALGNLTIMGEIQMKAKFPDSFETGNIHKAIQIASAIESI